MAEVKTVKASAGEAVINEILERDGCIVIEDVLDLKKMTEIGVPGGAHGGVAAG